MSDASALYLLKPFNSFPVSDTKDWLGRVVATYSDPRDKYTPSLKIKIPLEERFDYDEDGGFRNVAQILRYASTTTGKANICDMFGINLGHMESSTYSMESPRVWHLKLHNPEKILNERLLGPQNMTETDGASGITHEIVREVEEFPKAWMIVGFLLCKTASYGEINDRGREVSGHVDPAQLAETCITPGAGFVPALLGSSLDLQGKSTANQHHETHTDMHGKRVFAIQYREVRITTWWQFWRKATAKLGKKPAEPCLFVDSKVEIVAENEEERVILDNASAGVPARILKDTNFISLASPKDDAAL